MVLHLMTFQDQLIPSVELRMRLGVLVVEVLLNFHMKIFTRQ